MSCPAVVALLELFSSDSTLLQHPPTIQNLQTVAVFTRPTIIEHENPYIVFATLDYKPDTADFAAEGFSDVCKATEKAEMGTLSYNILKDKDNKNQVKTIEAYESEEYLWDPHATSQAVKSNQELTKDMRTNRHLVFLKLISGYFYKASKIQLNL
jgi:quinol monooxygenase YgiN